MVVALSSAASSDVDRAHTRRLEPRRAGVDFRLRQIALLYVALVPLLIVRPFGVALGAADLLLPLGLVVVVLALAGGIPIGAFLILAFGSIIAARGVTEVLVEGSGTAGLLRSLRPLGIVVPYLIGRLARFSEIQTRQLLKVGLYASFLAFALAVPIYVLDIDLGGARQTLYVGDGEGLRSRASGLIGNTGGFGHLLGAWMVLLILQRRLPDPIINKMATSMALATGGFLLLVSSSRGALLFIAIGCAAATLANLQDYRQRSQTLPAKVIGFGVVLSLIAYLVAEATDNGLFLVVLQRFDVLNLSGESTFFQSERRSTLVENLWRAVNSGAFGGGIDQLDPGAVESPVFVDNAYISSFIVGGVLAGLLYLVFWVGLATVAYNQIGIADQHSQIWIGLLAGNVLHGLFLDTFSTWASTPFILLYLGALDPRKKAARADR